MRLQTLLSCILLFCSEGRIVCSSLALNFIKSEYFTNINGVFKIKLQGEWMKNGGKDKLMLASNLRYENLILLGTWFFFYYFCFVFVCVCMWKHSSPLTSVTALNTQDFFMSGIVLITGETRRFHITICNVCLVCKEFWSSGTESKAAVKPQGPFISTASSPCPQL